MGDAIGGEDGTECICDDSPYDSDGSDVGDLSEGCEYPHEHGFSWGGRPIWDQHTTTRLERVVDVHGGAVAPPPSRTCVWGTLVDKGAGTDLPLGFYKDDKPPPVEEVGSDEGQDHPIPCSLALIRPCRGRHTRRCAGGGGRWGTAHSGPPRSTPMGNTSPPACGSWTPTWRRLPAGVRPRRAPTAARG